MKITNTPNDFVSFSAKYIIDGKKEELDIIEQKIQLKKSIYKSISRFSVCYNKENQRYMNLYATGTDSFELSKSSSSSEFISTFKNANGTLLEKFKHLAQFAFGSIKDINVIKAEDILHWYPGSGFHPDTGAVNHKTIQQLDGSTISYDGSGDVSAREILVDCEDGVKRTYFTSSRNEYLQREEYSDGTYRVYYPNGALSEKKCTDGSIIAYYIDGGISLEQDPEGNVTKFYATGIISSEEKIDGSLKKYLSNGNISKEIDASGIVTNYQYRKGNESLLFKISSDGNRYYYDEDGNQVDNVEIKKLKNGLLSVHHDSGLVLTYDRHSNLIYKIDSDGKFYEYGGKGYNSITAIVEPYGTQV